MRGSLSVMLTFSYTHLQQSYPELKADLDRSLLNSSHKEFGLIKRSTLLLSHTHRGTEINSCKYHLKILMSYTIFFLPHVHLNF